MEIDMDNYFAELLKKKIYRVLLLVTFLFLIISMVESCEKEKENKTLLNNISSIGLDNQKFKTEIKKNGDRIYSQNQIILTQKQAIQNSLIEIKSLKSIKSKVSVITRTIIDTLFVPYNRVVVDSSSSGAKQIRNYFDYKEPKGWYSISGYSSDFGVGIDSLSIKNDFSIYIADKKLGFFKKANPEVLLINRNPYTEIIQMKNVIITVNQSFYNKNSFWAGVGFVGGFLLAK
tara:strand:+ start:198 stop:893 length:696 start_codon:yes stop_codon:yes gene_type:complete